MPLIRKLPPQKTLKELEKLHLKGYIFRGQNNSGWKLESSAFRAKNPSATKSDRLRLQSALKRCHPEWENRLPKEFEDRLIQLLRFLENHFSKLLPFYQKNPHFDPVFQQMIKGCFIQFQKSTEHFLMYGYWPTIENHYDIYTDPLGTALIQYNLPASTIPFFNKIL